MAQRKPKTMKAQITRLSLIVSAACLLRESGPSAVTYRRVAKLANVSSASVQYHFESIDLLLSEAAKYNIGQWVIRAEGVADRAEQMTREEAREKRIELLTEACLPKAGETDYAAHYAQLIEASAATEVTSAYSYEREKLDAAISRILKRIGWKINPRLIVASVDGASVAAISEGRPVHSNVAGMLAELYFYTA